MPPTDSKRALLEGQANSKIYWGASRAEVLEWLTEEKGVASEDAERIVQSAFRIRAATIRRRAVLTLVFSAVGVLIAGFFTVLWEQGHMRRAWYLSWAIGTPSLTLLVKSIVNLVRGDSDEPLE